MRSEYFQLHEDVKSKVEFLERKNLDYELRVRNLESQLAEVQESVNFLLSLHYGSNRNQYP